MANFRGCPVSQRWYFYGSEVLCLQHKTQEFTKCVERSIELKANPRATLRIFTHNQPGIPDKKGKGKGGLDQRLTPELTKAQIFSRPQ